MQSALLLRSLKNAQCVVKAIQVTVVVLGICGRIEQRQRPLVEDSRWMIRSASVLIGRPPCTGSGVPLGEGQNQARHAPWTRCPCGTPSRHAGTGAQEALRWPQGPRDRPTGARAQGSESRPPEGQQGPGGQWPPSGRRRTPGRPGPLREGWTGCRPRSRPGKTSRI
jgi:hypothetical protein